MRRCACPCNAPLIGRSASARYIDHRHAQRAYRERVKAQLKAAGLPTSLSLASAETVHPTNGSNGDGDTGRRAAKRRRTELRISYRKAVEAIEAGRPLSSVLSPKQREALFAEQMAAIVRFGAQPPRASLAPAPTERQGS